MQRLPTVITELQLSGCGYIAVAQYRDEQPFNLKGKPHTTVTRTGAPQSVHRQQAAWVQPGRT